MGQQLDCPIGSWRTMLSPMTRAQVDDFRRVPAAPALYTAQSLGKRFIPMPLSKQLRGTGPLTHTSRSAFRADTEASPEKAGRAGKQGDAARHAVGTPLLPILRLAGSLPFHEAHENRLGEEKAKCNLETSLLGF